MSRKRKANGDKKRDEERAAIRRLLVYWGNCERWIVDKEGELTAIENELNGIYDLKSKNGNGMPSGGQISDPTAQTAMNAEHKKEQLERRRERIKEDIDKIKYRAEMIKTEVLQLPPHECEVIKLRYITFGLETKGFWPKVAAKTHYSVDNVKALERHGVDRLAECIGFGKVNTIEH